MEDILASIRRILSEDEGGAPAPDAPPTAVHLAAADPAPSATHSPATHSHEVPAHDTGDVLTLDPSMIVPDSGPPEPAHRAGPVADSATAARVEPAAHVDAPEPMPAEPVIVEPRPAPRHTADSASLVGPEAMSAAALAMGPLLRKIAADRSQAVYRGGPTLEDIVREEMRPLLKQWLDTNLPATVERLVRAEIERVVNSAVT
jgi:cell pole-organizing protein PopZ